MRILLADDYALFRESLALVIQSKIPEASTIQVGSWQELSQSIERVEIDLLLVDLFMPGDDSWEVALGHVIANSDCTISVLSASESLHHIETAFALGVDGYICKTTEIGKLTQAIQQLCNDQCYIPPQIRRSPAAMMRYQNSLGAVRRNRRKDVTSLSM